MKIHSFHIEIKSGKVVFKNEGHKKLFDKYIEQFPDGKYTLDVNEVKKSRTFQQNNYYWGVYLPLISEETGESVERLHALFKGMFLTKEVVEVRGHPVRITNSTTELSVGEFCDYIANIAQETEILPPDTTEFLGYSYHKN